jgi:hypothetical protein
VVEDVVMPGLRVAVASAVVMILKQHGGIEMANVIKARHMAWCSISRRIEIHPENAVTVMKEGPADAQGRGQGRLANDMSGGEAEAGTRTGEREPKIAIVTVTGIVTGGAKAAG